MHHVDGPIYYPQVVIISLGTPCLMTFRQKLASHEIGEHYGGDLFSVFLQPRSLLMFSDDAYHFYQHGIAADCVDLTIGENIECVNSEQANVKYGDKFSRGERTSLTIRKQLP
eukprot:gene19068-24890_t